jgi:pimeloyl-ACP methyl ester carboxylesterase
MSPPLPVLDGVRHEFVDAGDLRMHVATAGEGEPVVLLHTSFQHWWAWRHVIPALAARHRVICPDLRGCGWSDAPAAGYEKERIAADIRDLLDALGLERVRLVGHGFGGLIGVLVCLLHPERVTSYLAVGIVHPWTRLDTRLATGLWRTWYQGMVASPGLGPWVVRTRPSFLNWLFRGTSPRKEAWTDEDIDRYREVLRDPQRARAMSLAYRIFFGREFLPIVRGRYRAIRLRIPTLLLLGTRDFFFPTRAVGGYEPYADDLRVELLEGEGHFIPEENPDLFNAKALEFLAAPQREAARRPWSEGQRRK